LLLHGVGMRRSALAVPAVCATLLVAGVSAADAHSPGGKWGGMPSAELPEAARSVGRYHRHHRQRFGIVVVEAPRSKYLSDTAWFLSDSAVFHADPEPAPYYGDEDYGGYGVRRAGYFGGYGVGRAGYYGGYGIRRAGYYAGYGIRRGYAVGVGRVGRWR